MNTIIREKINSGIRINQSEGNFLLKEMNLLELGSLANLLRKKYNPNEEVTYVIDTNLNYTNLCDAYCSFCAFYRTDPTDPSAYTYSVDQIMEKIDRAQSHGVRTVLMQGGLNSDIPFEYYTDMVKETVKRFPQITPHYWSAPEIIRMSEVSGKSVEGVFKSLWNVGQRTMPGGGSEILSNRVTEFFIFIKSICK